MPRRRLSMRFVKRRLEQLLRDERAAAAAEPGPGMRRRADVPDALDRRPVARLRGERRQRKFWSSASEPPYGSPWTRLMFASCRSAGESDDAREDRRLEVRDVPREARLDAVGVALAQALRPGPVADVELAGRVALDRATAAPAAGPRGSPCRPARARGPSSAAGPTTTVASAGSRPRSASLTARETPSSPGVRCTIAVPPSRSSPSHRGGSESAKWICISERP